MRRYTEVFELLAAFFDSASLTLLVPLSDKVLGQNKIVFDREITQDFILGRRVENVFQVQMQIVLHQAGEIFDRAEGGVQIQVLFLDVVAGEIFLIYWRHGIPFVRSLDDQIRKVDVHQFPTGNAFVQTA